MSNAALDAKDTRNKGVVVLARLARRNPFRFGKALPLPSRDHAFNQRAPADLLPAADGSDPIEDLDTDAKTSSLPTRTFEAPARLHRRSRVPGYLIRNRPICEAECMICACDCFPLHIGLLGQRRRGGIDNRQQVDLR